MKPFNKILRQLVVYFEFVWIYSLGKALGISYIVRYLRNPNPLITVKLLRGFGAKVGNKTTIKRSLFIDNAYEDRNSAGDFSFLEIKDNCYIGDVVYFDLSNQIIIEDNSVISGQVSFITHADCNRSPFLDKKFPRISKPIIVRKGAWIGFGTTIMSDVTIGENSVVAACSLVRQNIGNKTVAGGVPAENIRKIE